MIRLTFQSDLAATETVIWERVSRMSGVNDELWPLVRMTRRPDGSDPIFRTPMGDHVAFPSWILLFGVLPIDRHALAANSIGSGFDERSSSWLQRFWNHRRRLQVIDGGTRVCDELEFEPRLRLLEPLVGPVIGVIFRHRHRRLARRFRRLDRPVH